MPYYSGTVLNTIGFNGYSFSHQPTDHHWVERDQVGVDGNGIAVYVAPRQYELKWDFLDTDEWNEIYAYFSAQGTTGTITARLPKWNATPYQFFAYSGCQIREMSYDNWFQNYYSGVRLLICRINNT